MRERESQRVGHLASASECSELFLGSFLAIFGLRAGVARRVSNVVKKELARGAGHLAGQ